MEGVQIHANDIALPLFPDQFLRCWQMLANDYSTKRAESARQSIRSVKER